MPLILDPGPAAGPLRQGEILGSVWEHRAIPVEPPDVEPPDNNSATVELDAVHHPFVVAMSPDCDLNQDFAARFPDEYDGFRDERHEKRVRDLPDRSLVKHVTVCVAMEEDEFKIGLAGGDILKRAKANQDQRYHHLGPAPIGQKDGPKLDVYLDFKRTFALPLEMLYEAVRGADGVERLAVIPPIYLHDVIQRFYSFQSRVGLPD